MGKLETKHSVAEGKARVLPSLPRRTTIVDLVHVAAPAAAATSFNRNWRSALGDKGKKLGNPAD
jgi:hypothetical protein